MLSSWIFLYEGVHKLKKEMFATTHACRYLRLRFDFNYFRAKKVPPHPPPPQPSCAHTAVVRSRSSRKHTCGRRYKYLDCNACFKFRLTWRRPNSNSINRIRRSSTCNVRALGPTSTRAHWLGFANWRQVFYIAPAPDGANAVCVRLLLQGLCWERQVLQEQAVPSSKWKPLPEHGGARFRFLGWQCVRARAVWCVRVHTMHIARRCQVWGSAVATILRNLRAAAARRRRGNVRSG